MRPRANERTRETLAAWFFLLPALVLLGLFVVWPTLRALAWSFTDARLLRPELAESAGWGNYSGLVQDPRFRQAFRNTALFALMVVPVQTALAFFLALWVNRPEPWWRALRTVFFVPVVVSLPVLAILWTMLYQPVRGDQAGLVNSVLLWTGLPPQRWLLEPRLALPALAFMSVWQGVGLQMLVFLAGLQQLDPQQFEAAELDGAGAWQRLVHVTVPGMRPTIIFVVTATLILSFRLFAQPYLMTRGGPEGSTRSLIQFIYETTFQDGALGMASAAMILFLVFVCALTLVQRKCGKEERA